MIDLIETTPQMDLVTQDIEHLVEELCTYHTIYSPLFQRREQREAAHTYLQGLLATLPRKSIEPMVLAVDGVAPKAVRAMQSFISEGQWNDERLLHQHWKEVEMDLGADEGVLMVDGSDFPKQGDHSVGVKRQYCGELGKRANCQAGVFVGYGSAQGYTLLDRRLYVPAEWLTDDVYAERRRQCGMPPETTFQTKPELAQEMITAVVKSQALRRDVETGELKTYLCNAPVDTALETRVGMSGMRWPIETCFEDGKQLLGMGDYEVRSWTRWHHHMTLVILAHFFVVRMSLRFKKKPQQ